MSGGIRAYQDKPLVLFSDTCGAPSANPPVPFPDFSGLPALPASLQLSAGHLRPALFQGERRFHALAAVR